MRIDTRPIAEDHRRICSDNLARDGLLDFPGHSASKTGTIDWRGGDRIGFGLWSFAGDLQLELNWRTYRRRLDGVEVEVGHHLQTICLVQVPTLPGVCRWFFVCECGRRCIKLYLPRWCRGDD